MSVPDTSTDAFESRKRRIEYAYRDLVERRNMRVSAGNGIYSRWQNPILTRAHVPPGWRYDFDRTRNPFLMERLGVNAVFNAGAMLLDGAFKLIVRVEGFDRKSFFAVASGENGTDGFRFDELPITMPETADRDTNVYDMRVTRHEDGWVYGLFCTERKDQTRPDDKSAAIASCGIARTMDLRSWERLADLKTPSRQQRNVVLHPEFVDGRYALYTRPQNDFIGASGEGLGWGLTESMDGAVVHEERIVDERVFHTIRELKNGQGPAPLKTDIGWIHLAHGVRNTCAGYRYVLYVFATDRDEPWRITHKPGGYLIAPEGAERVGDVSNVVFSNGWVADANGDVFIYYASSDTRMHVATSSIAQLTDYVQNTPEDPHFSADCVAQRIELAERNAIGNKE